MKTIKLFMMAALVLMTAACSSDDNDITTPTPQPVKPEGITITATLAPKNGGDNTRGLSNGTNKIVATWEENEKIAILYEVGGVKEKAEATVTAVNTKTGAATIQFTVDSKTANNTACTLVLPYTAAKEDNTGVKDAATLLATQTGSLSSEFMDVRVGEGTIQIANPGLTVTTQPAAQNAIFQIKAKKPYNSDATLEFNSLTVTIDGTKYVNIEKSPSSAQNDFYVALPPVSGGKVSFLAKDVDGNTYGYSKSGVTFEAGKYYQSTLKMMGAFSVGADKRVCFSQGNLQYNGSKWQFAENQWGILDYNGTYNTSSAYPIDLFTWGNTTLGAEDYMGTEYDAYSSTLSNIIAQGTAGSDWGYNAISNGGDKNSQWRTLTINEWEYLLKNRTVNGGTGEGKSYTVGKSINGIKGLVIYPDGYKGNAYSGNDWDTFEHNGCVFLPAGGYRNVQSVTSHSSSGYYWSASCSGSSGTAYFLEFDSSSLNIHTTWTGDANKQLGYSVRLVRDL
jgi:hypothetical protein